MKVTFITNYLTHHQLPFTEEMYRLLGDDFCFIATNRMDDERIRMGWGIEDQNKYPYIRFFDDDMKHCDDILMESDIVICGGTHEFYIKNRIAEGKITLRYFERLYKKGQWRAFTPRGYFKKWKEHTAQKNKPVYLLCAGAYVASDFHLFGAYPGKMLKWGYFPSFHSYDTEALMKQKNDSNRSHVCEILWTGRMIGWKHSEDAVKAVKILLDQKEVKTPFHLTMVGDGECASVIRDMIEKGTDSGQDLSEMITMRPFMKPEEIRRLMEKSDIYLMTSDHEEGWGAVVNEAMNSGCAVIASAGAGSVPYLIRHGENGLVYRSGNVKELAKHLACLVEDASMRKQLGCNAYQTIASLWNPSVAAERMVHFCEGLLAGECRTESEGPLSAAELIRPGQGYAYCHGTLAAAHETHENRKESAK